MSPIKIWTKPYNIGRHKNVCLTTVISVSSRDLYLAITDKSTNESTLP